MNIPNIMRMVRLTTAFQTVYVPPLLNQLEVTNLMVVNTTGSTAKVSMCLLAEFGSPDVQNAIIWEKTMTANDVYTFAAELFIGPGVTLVAKSDTNDALNLVLSGSEYVASTPYWNYPVIPS